MGYSKIHQERFIVKNIVGGAQVVDMDDEERKGWCSLEERGRKVHNQIQKLRAEDLKLGLDVKEALVNGNYRVGGGGGGDEGMDSVVMFSRQAALPSSPLGGKTPLKHGY